MAIASALGESGRARILAESTGTHDEFRAARATIGRGCSGGRDGDEARAGAQRRLAREPHGARHGDGRRR